MITEKNRKKVLDQGVRRTRGNVDPKDRWMFYYQMPLFGSELKEYLEWIVFYYISVGLSKTQAENEASYVQIFHIAS